MNKETFLKELREYLKILEDKEQEDILAEYAQHIDMKMQKGLSEEEALRDFGSMEELAAEILEAYHVKPEFGQKKEQAFLPKIKDRVTDGGKLLGRMGRFIKEKSIAAIRGIGSCFCRLWKIVCAVTGWLTGPFRRKKERTEFMKESENGLYLPDLSADTTDDLKQKDTQINAPAAGVSMNGAAGSMRRQMPRKGTKDMITYADNFPKTFFGTIGRGIKAVWQALVSFCIWGLKLLWNCGWLMASLITAFLTMIALMGFGMVVILLLQQGYPFKGFFLLCLGGILCFASLTCAAFSMIIRKKEDAGDAAKKMDKNGNDKDNENDDRGEVQYE